MLVVELLLADACYVTLDTRFYGNSLLKMSGSFVLFSTEIGRGAVVSEFVFFFQEQTFL